MKVGFLTTSFPRFPGDFAGNFLLEEAKALERNDVSVTILAPHYPGSKKEEIVEGVRVKRFNYFWPENFETVSYKSGLVNNIKNPLTFFILPFFALFFVLNGLMTAREVDLIHAHWIQTAIVARFIKILTGKKYVVTALGSDVDVALRMRFLKAISFWGLSGSELIIAGNQYLFDQLVSMGIESEKLIKVNMGINKVENFLEVPDPKSTKTGIFVGRLSEEKNLELVIRILNKTEDGFKVVVAGDGPERARLAKLARDLGVEKKIKFLGQVSFSDLPNIFREGSFMLLPQKRGGFGLSVLESMAAGRPVIHSKIEGSEEIIKNGQNGFLVPLKEEDALVEAVNKLINDKKLLLKMSKNARATVSNYTWSSRAHILLSCYQKILA